MNNVDKHREQEYGIDHPWEAFDNWHKIDHEVYGYSWPCATPLRCLWRFTRKTGTILTQEGTRPESHLKPKDFDKNEEHL